MAICFETIKALDVDDNVMNSTDMIPAFKDITFIERLNSKPEAKCK